MHDVQRDLGVRSRPSRACGLKYGLHRHPAGQGPVTPFAGVWIEISFIPSLLGVILVTPFAGVWIEIYNRFGLLNHVLCHALRGRVD